MEGQTDILNIVHTQHNFESCNTCSSFALVGTALVGTAMTFFLTRKTTEGRALALIAPIPGH